MSWAETLFLKKIIDGKKSFKVSNNALIDLGTKSYTYSEYNHLLLTFTPKISGQIRLNYTMQNTSTHGISYFYVYEDELKIVESSIESLREEHTFEEPISVKKGKKYTFLISNKYSILIFGFRLCADIVDGSTFDFSIGGDE